ncbi:MAG: penicillin-binding protein 2 [Epsilonproteobacteria bacterium]|nr:MAG: penicillin-binding protein 2 [Campylobacterota bacterium]
MQKKTIDQRKNKISFLFLLLLLALGIFLFSILKTLSSKRHIPSGYTTLLDRSFRGSIISADGYTLSHSQKNYQAIVRAESIKPEKKELFITLFSIYSGIPKNAIHTKFLNKKGNNKKGNIILSKHIDAGVAMQLKALSYKLRKLAIFRSIKNRNGIEIVYGLDIIENAQNRQFPLGDVLSPVLGYVGKKSENKYTYPVGKKGLERAYEKHISPKRSGYLKGKRDVVSAVIHDKNTISMQGINGYDLHLNIPIALQRRIELMIDKMKKNLDAEEILVAVMESQTGKVISLASTRRYDPSHIQQQDIPALVPKFTEYPYEAGSVMKPITLAIALDNNAVKPNSWFDTHYKKFDIGEGKYISDDEKFEALTATDIIVYSSNIGISQISWRLSGKEFRQGLLDFGIARPSGTDLSRDLAGQIKSLHLLNHKLHRANTSYGYGMLITFAQLFKAYAAFNNNGIAVSPRIVNYLQDAQGKQYTINPKVGNLQAIRPNTAKQIQKILKKVVSEGTGKNAQYAGLEVGGKTGTAHIAKKGHYVNEYHSSFYGFANDNKGHKYTIGALVIRAKKPRAYFASKSSVPTFRRVLDILVELDYLYPEGGLSLPSPTLESKPKHFPKISKPIIKREPKKYPKKQSLKLKTKPNTVNSNKVTQEHLEGLF